MNELTITEHKNVRVLTTQQIAEAYGTTDKIISNNFNNNKERYVEGKHFFCLVGEELRAFKGNSHNLGIAPNTNRLYLWTEKGAFLHAKSLNTDTAWTVYERLVDAYFMGNCQIPMRELSPELQIMQGMLNQLAKQELDIKRANEKSDKAIETVSRMKEEILAPLGDWRKDVSDRVRTIAYHTNIPYQNLFNEMYSALEVRAHCNLETLKRNKASRMEKAGKTKSCIRNETTKLAVIEDNDRLREIFSGIVREYSAKYLA